ncbi:hypothetical protein AAW00_06415 [Aurantiacibacter luteus]|uniref:Uncharacterized protein n=1 Tax=Aurantiacibacter luteus TaxID=1581420 RepID=A0A0G9MVP2_9SPHN|nr:hypothetical protein AAW00_06415 [Aurantiacibacter luteus]
MGVHGRPDINPYERDIDMTVPLTFLSRSLGDIPMRLTADDRFLLDSPAFLRLMRTVLNAEAHSELSATLAPFAVFGPEDLAETGVALTYDPASLAVVVVQVRPDQRAVEDLFAPPRDDLNDVNLAPAALSAYLNLNASQTYVWGADDQQRPTINIDGAVRFGRVVFEGDASLGEEFGLTDTTYRFARNYARFVYDQPEDYRRWFLGDLDPEVRGQQSFVQMGGIGVARQQRRFNTFRAAVLQGNRQLVLQRQATVRFFRNGSLYRELRLQPGRYDYSSLPLLAGSNDVRVEVQDITGAVQDLSYSQYLDPIDLDPGDYEYGAYLGATSRQLGRAPDYRGPLAFTGFFRKAFFGRPAIGIGVQASAKVQSLTGQTQFVLPNGARLLLDAGASRSNLAGAGYAAGIAYDQFFDRGGLADNFSLRADYVSPDFANLSNPEGFNLTALSVTGQYTRQFSQSLLATVSGSYLKGREETGDTYRIGATAFYRINERWTVRAGVDYAGFPREFAIGSGFSANIGLVFQPDYRRRAEARYESRDNLAELSYTQSGLNELNSVGFGGVLTHREDSVQAQGFASYAGNRFDASVSHAAFGPSLSSIDQLQATSVRVGTTIAFADGVVGMGRRINDSFALVYPHETLGDRSVVAGASLAQNNYLGKSGGLGAAVNNFLASYVTQSVQYDVENPPTGYDIGPGVVRVRPPYRSGYAVRVGTEAFISATGTLVRGGSPVSLAGGRTTLLDLRDGENPQPMPFFTNTVGRFAISSLLPGRRYLVETYGNNGTTERSFEFTVPADNDGLVDLGTVVAGVAR